MILELDCGNTQIKWRLLDPSAPGSAMPEAVSSIHALFQCVRGRAAPARCRLVSVRSDEETEAIVRAIAIELGIPVERVLPSRGLGGVVNGYVEYERLGLDRWLAVVAAYRMVGKACLVIDLGTAVTVDLVDAHGEHLGGFITPGLSLMRKQLFEHTRRVRYLDLELPAVGHEIPGRSTAEAVERGCQHMLRAYVESQRLMAERLLGEDMAMLATGGDARLVADIPGVQCVPDLVFRGLALACP